MAISLELLVVLAGLGLAWAATRNINKGKSEKDRPTVDKTSESGGPLEKKLKLIIGYGGSAICLWLGTLYGRPDYALYMIGTIVFLYGGYQLVKKGDFPWKACLPASATLLGLGYILSTPWGHAQMAAVDNFFNMGNPSVVIDGQKVRVVEKANEIIQVEFAEDPVNPKGQYFVSDGLPFSLLEPAQGKTCLLGYNSLAEAKSAIGARLVTGNMLPRLLITHPKAGDVIGVVGLRKRQKCPS